MTSGILILLYVWLLLYAPIKKQAIQDISTFLCIIFTKEFPFTETGLARGLHLRGMLALLIKCVNQAYLLTKKDSRWLMKLWQIQLCETKFHTTMKHNCFFFFFTKNYGWLGVYEMLIKEGYLGDCHHPWQLSVVQNYWIFYQRFFPCIISCIFCVSFHLIL